MNITVERTPKLVGSFVGSMKDRINYFAKGQIPNRDVELLAEQIVNRLDFNNETQMHKGLGYWAKNAVKQYLGE